MKDARSPLHDRIFEILVDRVRDYAIFALDPEGRVATWNSGARLLKGYLPEDIIGRHFSVFYLPDAMASGWPAQELQAATMQGRFEDEGWRVRKDGSRFWANVIITALRDQHGKLIGFSKITRDLTARRDAEDRLRQSEERFRLLVEGVQDYAIYMLDPDGIVTSWNSGAQKMKGYLRDDVIGKHVSMFYLPEDIAGGKPWEELAVTRSTGRSEDEGWRVRKSGEKFWARVVLSTLRDGSGRLRGFAKVTQDLSQREYARDLEKAAQRVNEFIAMLAHELRNPLAPIRSAVNLLQRLPAGDPVQQELLSTVERQSAHLTRIVDDMLDIARITRGALSLERHAMDLAQAVERAVEIAAPGIQEAGHVLRFEPPAAPLYVNGDLARVTQIVANLLTNATRFTPAGGRITVKMRQEGVEAVVSVEDTGRGIPADSLQSIFGMFVQGKEPIHRIGGGLGIGLALARRIAELHGGRVEARSAGEGQGSEFIVRLPLGEPPAAAPQQAAVAPQQAAAAEPRAEGAPAKRVLIVDDNVDAARTLDILLSSLGHATRVAYDGTEALRLAEEFRPEVILLDLGLPGLNGYEVARRLRARNGQPVRIVAVTGWSQAADRARSAEAGFDLHMVKPIDESVLRRIIDEGGAALH
jgi:PAS domain S-box-containing protein